MRIRPPHSNFDPAKIQMASRLLPELPLFLMTAVATHLFMSFAQTLMHYKLTPIAVNLAVFFANRMAQVHATSEQTCSKRK
jgi:hypothetical protein